ncbi:hypothetical protein MPSEU_000912300 [Mayamaea pseudoterrestris]|nr:hypothetical protein MPSEU_000912300 [Mayamaea pseudoterrestris]
MMHAQRRLRALLSIWVTLAIHIAEARPSSSKSNEFYSQQSTPSYSSSTFHRGSSSLQPLQQRKSLLDGIITFLQRWRHRRGRGNVDVSESYLEQQPPPLQQEHSQHLPHDSITSSPAAEQTQAVPYQASQQPYNSVLQSTARQLQHHSQSLQFPPPRKLLSIAASGVQIGLLCWLGNMVWKAFMEVLEEYSQEITSQEDPLLCKRDQVTQVVSFLQQDPTVMQNQLDSKKKRDNLPPMHLLQIARQLVMAGLPLTAPATDPSATSVQYVLSRMTKTQANMLQQCLRTASTAKPSTKSNSPWDQVIGLEPIKERLVSALALTVNAHGDGGKQAHQNHRHAFRSLFDHSAMTGILLYGPPGCGKTLLVKSLASAARLSCLVVAPSVLLRKYVGETNAQVKALFGLTQLLAPCVVCIDELDGLFRERRDDEHEVSRDLKTEFLQWWDGLLHPSSGSDATASSSSTGSINKKRIIIIGATNRPFDVDAAVLRRLPQSHFVGLPDGSVRAALLKQLLAHIPNTCLSDADGMNEIVAMTERYTPSDLKQVLQTAALMGPMREPTARPLTTDDVRRALQSTPPTPLSLAYRKSLAMFCQQQSQLQAQQPQSFLPFDGVTHAGPDAFILQPKWETDIGNFYNVGSIGVDHDTFDALSFLVDLMDSSDASDHDGISDLEDDNFSDEGDP